MKRIPITMLIAVLASCESRQTAAPAETLDYSIVRFDSLTFKQLILENDKLLGIVTIALRDAEKSKKINELIRSDSFKIKLYQRATFNIEKDIRCEGSRHLYISKKEKYTGGEQKNQEFLVIINGNGKINTTEKLKEQSFYSDGSQTSDSIVWTTGVDSLIYISLHQVQCSDAIIEGQESNCGKKRTNKAFKLACDALKLISADSTGWDKI